MAEHVNSYFHTGGGSNRFPELNGTDVSDTNEGHSATLTVGPSGSVTYGAHTFWNTNKYEVWLQVGWPGLAWMGWMDITPGQTVHFNVDEGRGQTFTVTDLPPGAPARAVVKFVSVHGGHGFMGVTLATDSEPPAPPEPTPPPPPPPPPAPTPPRPPYLTP